MFANTLTLDTHNYDLVSQSPYRSMRSDATKPVSEPSTLTISHEVAKTGRRSSVVILDDNAVINSGTSITKDSIKSQFKIQFNPYSGRTAADIETTINEQIAQLQAFISVPGNIDKFLNLES